MTHSLNTISRSDSPMGGIVSKLLTMVHGWVVCKKEIKNFILSGCNIYSMCKGVVIDKV